MLGLILASMLEKHILGKLHPQLFQNLNQSSLTTLDLKQNRQEAKKIHC